MPGCRRTWKRRFREPKNRSNKINLHMIRKEKRKEHKTVIRIKKINSKKSYVMRKWMKKERRLTSMQ